MPIAHVDPAKVEVLRDIYRRFPLPSDCPVRFAPGRCRPGEPAARLGSGPKHPGCLASTTPDHLALLAQLGSVRGSSCRFGSRVTRLRRAHAGLRRFAAALRRDRSRPGERAGAPSGGRDRQRDGSTTLSQNERSRVEAATRAKDEFVAMVSHELRTPLNAILGWLRLMRSGSFPEGRREHAIDVIERNAQAQNQLVARPPRHQPHHHGEDSHQPVAGRSTQRHRHGDRRRAPRRRREADPDRDGHRPQRARSCAATGTGFSRSSGTFWRMP